MNTEQVCGADYYRCDLFTSGSIPAVARFTAAAAYYVSELCWDSHVGSGPFRIEVVYGKELPFYTLPSTPLALLASGCRTGPQYRWERGIVCTCEQRSEVARYVADSQRSGMADDSDYYLNNLFAIAVATHCERRDSVYVFEPCHGCGWEPVNLAPCEYYSDGIGPARP